MKPRVFSSLITFIAIGIWSTVTYDFKTDPIVKIILVIVIFSSALYYYYLNLATEQNYSLKRKNPNKAILSWWITAFQYLCFLLLWYLLREKLTYYAVGILALNISYCVWDFLHRKEVCKEKKYKIMMGFDIAGLVLSLALLVCTLTLPAEKIMDSGEAYKAMGVAIVGAFLIVKSIGGFIVTSVHFRYNPFRYLDLNGEPIKAPKG